MNMSPQELLRLWQGLLVQSVQQPDLPDLTVRQLAIMLVVFLEKGPHTVRSLAAHLNLAKPAVTRALDRLEGLGYVRRQPDKVDKRSVFITPSLGGVKFLGMLTDGMELVASS